MAMVVAEHPKKSRTVNAEFAKVRMIRCSGTNYVEARRRYHHFQCCYDYKQTDA